MADINEITVAYRQYLARLPKHNTRTDYSKRFAMLERWCSMHGITHVEEIDFLQFLDWVFYDRGVSPRTRNNYRTWCRSFCSWLRLTPNPMDDIKPMKEPGKKSDGCRIWWTRDFSTFTEATIIDYNGQPYSREAGKTRFFILKPKAKHIYVDGVEHYCFWDYIITTTNPRMWYAISDENGVTVRAAFAFGLSSFNGSTLPARHGHEFAYNPYNGYFYALTGDSVNECHVMRGRYVDNNGTHTWTWEKLATGGGYKLVSVDYDEGNLYALTDYTESALVNSKGIVSIPIDKIGLTTSIGGVVSPAKIRYWFKATAEFMAQGSRSPSSPAAISGYCTDNNGWRISGTDYLGGSKHLIAKGGHNFVWVDNDAGLKLGSFIGPNNKGDIIITASPVGSTVSGEDWLKMSHKLHYNLTEIMRRSGATDFFEGWKGTLY